MGNNCSCLSDMTSLCSEDLSQAGNNDGMTNRINNNPKKNLISPKYDTMISQTTNELNSINSNKINITKKRKQKQNNNKKNNKNILNNKNTNNIIIINNRGNNIDNIKFEEFLNSPRAQEMSKKSENNSSYKLCMKLHKYFLKIIKKKSYLKNIKKYKEEGENLFNSCVKQIYISNEMLSKAEQSYKIK